MTQFKYLIKIEINYRRFGKIQVACKFAKNSVYCSKCNAKHKCAILKTANLINESLFRALKCTTVFFYYGLQLSFAFLRDANKYIKKFII